MNVGQIKLDNKERRQDIITPSRNIDKSFKAQAQSDYEKKKEEERRNIMDQINRVTI